MSDLVEVYYFVHCTETGLIPEQITSIGLVNRNLDYLYLEKFTNSHFDCKDCGLIYQDTPVQKKDYNPYGVVSQYCPLQQDKTQSGWVIHPEPKDLNVTLQDLVSKWLFDMTYGNTVDPLYELCSDFNQTSSNILRELAKERIESIKVGEVDINFAIAEHMNICPTRALGISRECFYLTEIGDIRNPENVGYELDYSPERMIMGKRILNMPQNNALRNAFILMEIHKNLTIT